MTNEVAGFDSVRKNVLICDTQPVAVEGMKWLIENSGDLHFIGSVPTLDAVFMLLNPEAARMAAELAAAEAAAETRAQLDAVQLAAPDVAVADATIACADGDVEHLETACCSAVCDVEAPASEALATEPTERLELSPALPEAVEIAPEPEPLVPAVPIDAVVIDKGLGLAGVMELLHKLAATSHPTPTIVWGAAISESEALRLLQAGARGIVRRTSDSNTLLTCLRAVTTGGTWMEDGIFGSTEKLFNPRRSQLTQRESEVVVLVEKGFRNRDIARVLGIQTGTVKIHLKHIFEKTGVRGRYGLAFTGLQNKGTIALTAPPQFTA